MALDPQQTTLADAAGASSVVAALSVYVEPLVQDARIAVLGDGELGLEARLLELGARTVHLFDPDPERVARIADEVPRGVSVRMLRDDFDVRDGAFDLVVIPDVGILPDPSGSIVRLRRVVDARGAVVAMGRARTSTSETASFPELAPAAVEYAELYDLFALQFENVTMTGVLPFRGVVFAELGVGDELSVSVDTRLVDPEPPGVFVVLASRAAEPALDRYAIVQVEPSGLDGPPRGAHAPAEQVRSVLPAALAEMEMRVATLAEENDRLRGRLASSDRRGEELAEVVVAAQQALGILERRLVSAEHGVRERDDRIAELSVELDERPAHAPAEQGPDPDALEELYTRAEGAESELEKFSAEMDRTTHVHAAETEALEAQLRERAAIISALEREVQRREQLVAELVASLEEARAATTPLTFETAPHEPGVPPAEVARLRRKLDELAVEVARREGELAARAWRITELENDRATQVAAAAPADSGGHPALERELAAARDELDVLRRALTQEHAVRVAAESGEELVRARAELARQEALLEQMRNVTTPSDG